MLAIPVIEVKAGRCVHTHLDKSKSKIIADDAFAWISKLVEQGAEQVKLVDVDAISNRQPEHLSLVSKIKKQFPDLKLQISGGVTCNDDIQIWLDAGADWVTIGGRLLRKYDDLELILVEMGKHLIVSLDVKESFWKNGYCPVPGMAFSEWIQALQEEGVNSLMFTLIPEQGHVSGANLLAAAELSHKISLPVIAHGGVLSRHDLLSLSAENFAKLRGVSIGKPLLEGVFTFSEAKLMLDQAAN